MVDFLQWFSTFTYVLLIIGSVLFGVSLGVNAWLGSTLKKVNFYEDKNFSKIKCDDQKNEVEKIIASKKKEFALFIKQVKLKNKVVKQNKVRKFFRLTQKQVPEITVDVKSLFIVLAKDVSYEFFTEGDERGYLSFSEREMFNLLKTLRFRLENILSSTKVFWLKTVKISFLIKLLTVYNTTVKFTQKLWFVVITSIINFFMWFARVFSPVGSVKYLVKNISGSGVSSLVFETLIELIGKELAVIYYERANDVWEYRLEDLSK